MATESHAKVGGDEVLPPGARGEWAGGWSATTVSRSTRQWKSGWNREVSCPPDRKGRSAPGGTWRELPREGGSWRKRHTTRRSVHRKARRAGYVPRWRWGHRDNGVRKHGRHEVPSRIYIEGPCVGLEVVDPWEVARKLERCCATWRVSLRRRADGSLTVLPLPELCGQGHVCPVCAAAKSKVVAGALREVIAAQAPETMALVTLTQRADPDETLHSALERWRGAWRRMVRGRPGRAWRARVSDWYYGLEVTQGSEGRWWHVHAHVLLRLQPGQKLKQVRRQVGESWRAATEAERSGWGWDPYAGGCEPDAGDWRGGWWREVEATNLRAVYQAAKYPSPCAELSPVALAEFLSVAHGRRWHEGGGSWRHCRKLADELALAAEAPLEKPEDIGVNIASMAPSQSPDLDQVAPDLGYAGQAPRAPPVPTVAWELAKDTPEDVVGEVVKLGGRYEVRGSDQWAAVWVVLPSEWVAGELRRWCARAAVSSAGGDRCSSFS